MDKLILKGLKFHGMHGVYDQEKIDGNHFEVDLECSLSLQKAGETDDLKYTLDYAQAHEIVTQIMTGESLNLIESLTLKIGEKIFSTFQLQQLKVNVKKLNPPMEGSTEYSEVIMLWPR